VGWGVAAALSGLLIDLYGIKAAFVCKWAPASAFLGEGI
jgi:hypothetical protein